MSNDFDVACVGSCIMDFISYVPRLPKPGETLRATTFQTGFGGKGANQCVAAAKLGSKTAIIGKVGSDKFGEDYLDQFKKENVCSKYVKSVEQESTGVALINVADNGENQIVIATGANALLSPDDVDEAMHDVLSKAKILICQLETPLSVTLAALRQFKGISILNAAPALNVTSLELLTLPTILCINETEAATMTKCSVSNIFEAKRALTHFLCIGCRTVIITLGEEGAIFATNDISKAKHIRPTKVKKVIDTTGAGDAFIGALAHFIAKYPDVSLEQQIGAACEVATMSVEKLGTQSSFPRFNDLQFNIENHQFNCVDV